MSPMSLVGVGPRLVQEDLQRGFFTAQGCDQESIDASLVRFVGIRPYVQQYLRSLRSLRCMAHQGGKAVE